jgi:hypothetical protein
MVYTKKPPFVCTKVDGVGQGHLTASGRWFAEMFGLWQSTRLISL